MANKKKTNLTEEQAKVALALRKADHEREKKEWALEPYTLNQPYDINLRIQQGRWCLKQVAGMHFFLGCILMELKERENLQTFAKILSEEFGGMSERTAYNYMLFAKKCVELNKIKEFSEKNWSKTLALLHSTTDEQLKEIEEKGIDGKALDEYDGLSVRDFKKLVKKYKDHSDKVVKAETYDLRVERDKLIEENKRLKAFDPEGKDASWAVEQMKAVEALANEFDVTLRKFAFDKRVLDHPEIQAKVEAIQRRMEKRFELFVENWDAFTEGDE